MKSILQNLQIKYKRAHGKVTISLEALDMNRRGLLKGKERLSDYQSQYQNGVKMYKALINTIQNLESLKSRSRTLKNDEGSKSFLHSKLTINVHDASKILKENEQKMHDLSDELASAEKKLESVNTFSFDNSSHLNATKSNRTIAASSRDIKIQKEKRKRAVIDRMLASNALNIARQKVEKARGILVKEEGKAINAGIKMLSKSGGNMLRKKKKVRQQEAELKTP